MDGENHQVIGMIRDDIKEMKQDIKELLAFKWKIIGGSVGLSAVVSFLVTIASKVL